MMISRTLSMVSIFQNSYQSAMVWIETLNERYFLNKSLIWFRIPTLYRIFKKTWQSVWILKQSKCISNTSDSSSLCSSTSPLHNHHEKNENSSAKIINYNIWLTVTSHTVRLMQLRNGHAHSKKHIKLICKLQKGNIHFSVKSTKKNYIQFK